MKEENDDPQSQNPKDSGTPSRPAPGRPSTLDGPNDPDDPDPHGIIIAPGKGDEVPPPEPPKP